VDKPVSEPIAKNLPALVLGVREAGSAGSRSQIEIAICDPQTNNRATLIYPGDGPADKGTLSRLKGLSKGDKILVSAKRVGGMAVLTDIETVPFKEGEDKPGVFLFEGTRDDKTGPASVILTQSFKTQTLPIRMTRDTADNKVVRDPEICKTASMLQKGALVYADVEPVDGQFSLVGIEPYHPPLKGEFIRLLPKKDGQDSVSIEVQTASGKQEYAVRNRSIAGRDIPDPHLLAAVRMLRPGQPIECRLDEKNDHVLLGIWPAKEKSAASR
jgi:hypothetical protein